MPKNNRRQGFGQYSSTKTVDRSPITSPLRAAPDTVPKMSKKQKREALLAGASTAPDQVMDDPVLAPDDPVPAPDDPVPAPDDPVLAPDDPVPVDEPWLVYQKSLPKQDVSDCWTDSPETEKARLASWYLGDKILAKSAERAHATGTALFDAWVACHTWELRNSTPDVSQALDRYIISRSYAQAAKDAILRSTATSHQAKKVCRPVKAATPPRGALIRPPVSKVTAAPEMPDSAPFIEPRTLWMKISSGSSLLRHR
jgi:hypothetical protein